MREVLSPLSNHVMYIAHSLHCIPLTFFYFAISVLVRSYTILCMKAFISYFLLHHVMPVNLVATSKKQIFVQSAKRILKACGISPTFFDPVSAWLIFSTNNSRHSMPLSHPCRLTGNQSLGRNKHGTQPGPVQVVQN